MVISNECRERTTASLSRLIQRAPGMLGAEICSTDGRTFARSATDSAGHEKSAAMSASIMALGESMMNELRLGKCSHLALSGEAGQVVAMRVPRTHALFVLTVHARNETSLGMMLSLARACAEEVGTLLEAAVTAIREQRQAANLAPATPRADPSLR